MSAPTPIEVESGEVTLRGERSGKGPAAVLVHGLTATRRYVIHGSKALERAGYDVVTYDARGHGESDGASPGTYDYRHLAADLGTVVEAVAEGGDAVFLAGHSMGAHTIARFTLENADRVRAIGLIGPVYPGFPPTQESLDGWDELADGLDRAGVEGFMDVYANRDWPAEWREVVMRITRERLERHRDLGAVATAIREVSRSSPFGDLTELESIECPALVVASHDEADPGHPYAIAERWAESIPGGELTSEETGKSPLAWQGGRLARVLAAFFDAARG